MRISSALAVLFALLMFSTAAFAVSQPWYIEYEKATKFVEQGKYEDAERTLLHLIEVKPFPEAEESTYGMWTTHYTPFFYLGEALMGQHKSEGAMRAYRASYKFAVAQTDPAKRQKLEQILGPKAASMRPASID